VRLLRSGAFAFAVALVVLVALLPIYQMLLVSLLPQSRLLDGTLVPDVDDFSLANYRSLFSSGVVSPQVYVNSMLVGVASTVLATVISLLAGYALARYRFFGSAVFDRGVLVAYIIPPTLLLVPIYVTMVSWRLQDTLLSVILAHVVLSIPFTIWLLRGFLMDIPRELDEAARVDGASRLGVLFRVILPLSLPGIAAAGVFAFIESWNEFLFASVLVTSPQHRTFPFGLYALAGTYGDVRWGEAMAAATIGAVPIFVLFLLMQRWLVSGLTSGAVKG
jgi:ABC-type glycerol-3-phosphate transport system permease component